MATEVTEVLHVHPAMYHLAVQRYGGEYLLTAKRTFLGLILAKIKSFFGIPSKQIIRSVKNPNFGKFKIRTDPSLNMRQYRFAGGAVAEWPRDFCPVRLNFEVVAAEDPTKDGPYIVLNGRTIAKFSGTAEERSENARLW